MCKPGSCNGCMWWEQLDWPSDFSKWVPWNDRFCFPAIYSISLIPLQLFGLIISMLLFCTMKYRQNSQTYKSYSPAADSQTNTGTAPRHHADSFIDDWRSFLWISTNDRRFRFLWIVMNSNGGHYFMNILLSFFTIKDTLGTWQWGMRGDRSSLATHEFKGCFVYCVI